MPKISAIIPNYNGAKYIRRCFDSILNQTEQDWEVICVDDGSTDDSAKIMMEYAARDKRFKPIIKKQNTKLSDTRNQGIASATGEYVWYIDSDDFIHPQSFEIGYKLATENNSDIVSFRKDRGLRTRLLIKKIFGGNVEEVNPSSMRKVYDVNNIDSLTVDNVFPYVTDRADRHEKYLIKHSYVWQHLCRRELVADIPFIVGITMEDFPWWASVLLKHPRVTITNLQFYYYIPVFGSIMASTKRVQKIRDVTVGIISAYELYRDHATPAEADIRQREFTWPFIQWMYKHYKKLDNDADRNVARDQFAKLYGHGVLDNANSAQGRRLQKKILKLIRE
ncbi:glycosyltransferase family 2 protein [Lachnospiraceae bacterium OttesenSCG-928-E19]|nr:glycosyltransferase family 2 protein [Lachnospiraceae bacterium OttesenSCG-928-E19]